MAHPEEPTLPGDTGQRKNKNVGVLSAGVCNRPQLIIVENQIRYFFNCDYKCLFYSIEVQSKICSSVRIDKRFQYSKTSTTPLGRSGKLSEVANTVAFLLSDGASYVHGVTLNVAGGKTRG